MSVVTRPSVCPLDCPDTCSLSVSVENDVIVSIRGSHANPYTAGVLCAKVPAAYPEFVHGEGRLRTPLRRVGKKGEGRFERIGWADALDLIHRRFTAIMAEHGPQAILPLNYAGPHGFLAGGSMDLRFFHKLGASLLDRRPLCGGIRSEAWVGTYGAVPGIRPEQAEAAKLIVAWGNNVTWTNLHFVPIVNRARRAGGKLVVVDPKRTKIAEQADLHLALRPGTDVVLAWAVTNELERTGALDREFIARHVQGFDAYMERVRRYPVDVAARICGVPEAQIREFAEWFRTASPVAVSVGNGLERNQNGGSGVRAVFALPALAGKLGVRGGGLVNGAGFAFPKTPARLARPEFIPSGTRTINIIDVGRDLLDPKLSPPIKALFVYNHNPLVVHPEQNRLRRGLERDDLFVVGCDVVMTDSLDYADVVLPACSHFEHHDLFAAYGTHWLQRSEPVIPPQAEALPNTEIFRRLAARFGFTDPAFTATDAELMDDALDPADARLDVRPSRIPTDRAIAMTAKGEEFTLFANVFPKTPSGKVELESTYLRNKYGAPLADYRPVESRYPLALISPASDKRITGTFGGCRDSAATPPLEMHPADANARGLRDGDRVKVWNDLGEVHLTLEITGDVPPGVVCSLKGAWMRTSDNGQTVSALAPSHHADISEGACYNDARVEVARL
jgi:anaerobic selenocysteine-containing dehydrogenase